MVDKVLKAEGQSRRDEILRFIERFTAEHGWAPTGAEIAEAVGVSATAVSKHLKVLEREGRLVRSGRLSRGLSIR